MYIFSIACITQCKFLCYGIFPLMITNEKQNYCVNWAVVKRWIIMHIRFLTGKQSKLTLRENVISIIYIFQFYIFFLFIVLQVSLGFKPKNDWNRLVNQINKPLNINEFLNYEITLLLQVWKQVLIYVDGRLIRKSIRPWPRNRDKKGELFSSFLSSGSFFSWLGPSGASDWTRKILWAYRDFS